MENYQIFFPGSSSSTSSASPSSITMADNQTYLPGDNSDGMKMDTEVQELDGNNINDGEMRSGKRADSKEIRRHKYAFQTRSRVDILDDGYRWRKYGQKTVKNNKYPRSYYKCTHKGCNVKKQVQRSSSDEEVVLTTYEGMHTHPIERFTESFTEILRQMHTHTTL